MKHVKANNRQSAFPPLCEKGIAGPPRSPSREHAVQGADSPSLAQVAAGSLPPTSQVRLPPRLLLPAAPSGSQGPPTRGCSAGSPEAEAGRLGPPGPWPPGFHQLISLGATCLLFPGSHGRNLMPNGEPTRQSAHSRNLGRLPRPPHPRRGPCPLKPKPGVRAQEPGLTARWHGGHGGFARAMDLTQSPEARGPPGIGGPTRGRAALACPPTSMVSRVLGLRRKPDPAGRSHPQFG